MIEFLRALQTFDTTHIRCIDSQTDEELPLTPDEVKTILACALHVFLDPDIDIRTNTVCCVHIDVIASLLVRGFIEHMIEHPDPAVRQRGLDIQSDIDGQS